MKILNILSLISIGFIILGCDPSADSTYTISNQSTQDIKLYKYGRSDKYDDTLTLDSNISETIIHYGGTGEIGVFGFNHLDSIKIEVPSLNKSRTFINSDIDSNTEIHKNIYTESNWSYNLIDDSTEEWTYTLEESDLEHFE